MSTVEVLLCTYNGRRHVREQLQSIEAQTRPVDRVSIRDDASSDDTVACIGEVIAGFEPARRAVYTVHVNPGRLGYAANFARSVAGARGDILLLCDQDDLWEPDKVEALLEAFAQGAPDLVFSDGSIVDAAGAPLGRRSVLQAHGLALRALPGFGSTAFEQLLKRNVVNGCACALRRAAAQAALPVPEGMPHDHWFALWCALNGGVALVPRRLYRYRQHEANAIGLGASRLLYRALGIWRHPRAPREHELAVWTAVLERIAALPCAHEIALARDKQHWLAGLLDRRRPVLARLAAVLRSLADGRYRRYSPPDAPLRDLVALIRRG